MFEIGFWEILLIATLTMIVVGPERLPGAARTAGRWFGKARRFVEGVRSDVESEFDVNELKRLIHNQEVQINELNQKLHDPNILDEQIESVSTSVYTMEDEKVEDVPEVEPSKKDAPDDGGDVKS